jgi:hypothetical protein
MYRSDPRGEFDTRITTLTGHGIQMPDEYNAVARRVDDFLAMTQTTPVRDKLVGIVCDGERDKNTGMASVYAAAVAEGLDAGMATPVRRAVLDAAHNRLVQIAAAAAPDIYAQLSAEWNDLAAEFTEHAKTTDLEATADDAHQLPEDARQAWIRGEQTAHQLERLLPVLQAAGELAGLPLNDEAGIPDEAALFALACRIDDSTHRRRAWEAWQHRGRCNRWAALAALGGITIKAANPDTFTPYPRPRPTELVKEPIAGMPRGHYRNVVVDPEDGKAVRVAEPFDPVRKTGRATIA